MDNSVLSMVDSLLLLFCANCILKCGEYHIFCCFFSYQSLLELHYGGRMNKSQTAREWVIEMGLSYREVE